MVKRSRPSRARGLKLVDRRDQAGEFASRPSRARGLKPLAKKGETFAVTSRPSRARGLKLMLTAFCKEKRNVAPLTGAWIETRYVPINITILICRAPHGRVD